MALLYAVHQLQLSHLCSFKTKLCMSAHCAFGELQLIRKLNYVLVNSFFLTLINKSVLVNNVEYFTQCALASFRQISTYEPNLLLVRATLNYYYIPFWTILEFVSGKYY